MKPLRPLFFLTAIILFVGLACAALSGGTTPTQAPPTTEPVQVEPTQALPTQAPPQITPELPTEIPTLELPPTEAALDAPDFYIEEFEADFVPDNWAYFTLGEGSDSDLVIEPGDDHLLFDLGAIDLYVYYIYAPYTYQNVSLTLNAENRGRNNNNVSLVCRMDEEGTQWYEFSVANNGLWYLWAFDNEYNLVDSGGTNSLRQGREENEYQMVCDDDEITLGVNGDEIKTVRETRYGFEEGLVGFNVSSVQDYSVLPITVEVNSFEISQP